MKKRSLFLNDDWDITLDGAGNLATTSGKYCDAQNVANAVRLFTQDAYIRQRQGVPHFSLDLGVKPSLSEVRAVYREAALGVENIADATVDIAGLDTETRAMTGTITATSENGETVSVEF
jgi:hypothetical protein